MNLSKMKNKASELRMKTFNAFIEKGEAHLGGSFSMIELLLVIYELIIKNKDKFILSKAHASFPLCIYQYGSMEIEAAFLYLFLCGSELHSALKIRHG